DFDWKGADDSLQTALHLAPADPALLIAAGNLHLARGDMTHALELYRRAVALDPVNPQARSYLAYNLAMARQFAEARNEYARVVELNPAAPWAHAGSGLSYLIEGRFEEAAVAAQSDAGKGARLLILACARWGEKRLPESDAALAQLTETFADIAAYQIAEVHAYRGDKDQAFEWLARARRQRDPGLAGVRRDLLLEDLHGDP